MSKKIFIVEDEPFIVEDLKISISNLGYTVVDHADNAEEALKFLSHSKVDLVLLDVNIKGEADGIDIGQYINDNLQIPFIYITSYFDANTISRAQKTKPSAYIVKPFKDADLAVNINLAFTKSTPAKPIIQKEEDHKDLHLFVRKNNEIKKLEPNSILWLEGDDNYTHIHCKTGEEFTISKTLKNITEQLETHGFFRIHKKYLINISKITSISGSNLFIAEKVFPIGKAYRKEFINQLTIF